MKTVKQLLTEARALIAEPAHWTQGAFAKNAQGEKVGSIDLNAVCWCASGAINRIFGENLALDAFGKACKVLSKYTGINVVAFNDSHTHTEVLEAFDKDIQDLST